MTWNNVLVKCPTNLLERAMEREREREREVSPQSLHSRSSLSAILNGSKLRSCHWIFSDFFIFFLLLHMLIDSDLDLAFPSYLIPPWPTYSNPLGHSLLKCNIGIFLDDTTAIMCNHHGIVNWLLIFSMWMSSVFFLQGVCMGGGIQRTPNAKPSGTLGLTNMEV